MRVADASAGWPYGVLDAARLRSTGWRPAPIREFVLKIHQRCNLACDYCYVYTQADQTWSGRPKVMARAIWSITAERIAAHAARHHLREVSVVLHGGEPLLAGARTLIRIAAAVRGALPAGVTARISTQTNGVLLTRERLAALAAAGIRIGVSLDGDPVGNDVHRRYANGRGSSAEVLAALRLLRGEPFRDSFAGLLCVADPAVDPVDCYRALVRHEPPAVDLLLPHANHATGTGEPGRYGPWLAAVFQEWYGSRPPRPRIRLFESVMDLILGGTGRSEHVGLGPVAVAVIETDGALEQTDALKSAYHGAAATGCSVLTDDFDAFLEHPGVVARQIGLAALCDTCLACDVRKICGGGHYAHRWRPGGDGFRNPSVYCPDLLHLIGHVQSRMAGDLERRRVEASVAP